MKPQKKEEETTHDEAMDLESMLESYGKDLDCAPMERR